MFPPRQNTCAGLGRSIYLLPLVLVLAAVGCSERPAEPRHFRSALPLGTTLRLELIHPVDPDAGAIAPFVARVVREVQVDGRVVIPIGSLARGTAVHMTDLDGARAQPAQRLAIDRIATGSGERIELDASCFATARLDECRPGYGPPSPDTLRPAGTVVELRVDVSGYEVVSIR